jgi:hypothetical protein
MYLIAGTIEAEEKIFYSSYKKIFRHRVDFYSESIIADFSNSSAMAKSASNQNLLSN